MAERFRDRLGRTLEMANFIAWLNIRSRMYLGRYAGGGSVSAASLRFSAIGCAKGCAIRSAILNVQAMSLK